MTADGDDDPLLGDGNVEFSEGEGESNDTDESDSESSGPGRLARLSSWLRSTASGIADRIRATVRAIADWLSRNRRAILRTLASVAIFAVAAVILRQSWLWAGPLATIVYTLTFLVGVSLIPVTVAMLGDMTPAALGKFEFVLGQLAFSRGWLVQHDREWRMHPGRRVDGNEEVYLDSGWQVVEDDENQTILGWQPFGLLLSKNRESLVEARVDAQAEALADSDVARSDGGSGTIERGGVKQVPRTEALDITTDPDPNPDRWTLDLKRYWSPGLAQMGDIMLIEKIEEVTMRAEAVGDRNEARNMIVGSILGVVLGAATGYVAMGGF